MKSSMSISKTDTETREEALNYLILEKYLHFAMSDLKKILRHFNDAIQA
ncbi:8305_t:CDS:2 [Funneliformis geosporum]|nr:8305_t:CDS:2 [Funneliformis geosporum]